MYRISILGTIAIVWARYLVVAYLGLYGKYGPVASAGRADREIHPRVPRVWLGEGCNDGTAEVAADLSQGPRLRGEEST